MTNRFDYAVHDIADIDIDLLRRVCNAAIGQNDTSGHPRFPTSDDWMVYSPWESQEHFERENPRSLKRESRNSGVILRNYCGTLELIVTDAAGRYILYNTIDGIPRDDLLAEYLREIRLVAHLVPSRMAFTFEAEKRRMFDESLEAIEND